MLASAVVGVAIILFAIVGRACRHAQAPAARVAKTLPSVAVRADAAARPQVPAVAVPGQARAIVAPVEAAGGVVAGRVISGATGDGVAGAELVFTSNAGATTVRTLQDGAFELAPATPGTYELTAVTAPGFIPYAPELAHSSVRVELVAKTAVRGVTIFLFPAVDYTGRVIDASGMPVAGARVKLAPTGEQVLEKLQSDWVADALGAFTFHAPDDAMLEAVSGTRRGWARVDRDVQLTRSMTIKLADAPARDASIRGRTIDPGGAPLADVLVRAEPEDKPGSTAVRATTFAVSGDDGTFTLERLDRTQYTIVAAAEDRAPAEQRHVAGGARDVTLVLDPGLPLAGVVVTPEGEPVPSYTLLVERRTGLVRQTVVERSIVDPKGRFAVRVGKGAYELRVYAHGWAASPPLPVRAGTKDIKIVLAKGATLRGVVVDAQTGAPLPHAHVAREGEGGGASAQPANAGTLTREDGTFVLAGIPAGPFTLSLEAADYHPRLEAGLVATDGAELGPLRIALGKLAPGEQPKIELVGIGVQLSADDEVLRVDMVVPKSGAADAGILVGDHITAVDGIPVTTLGLDGTVTRIRGLPGTTIAVTVERGGQTFVVTRKPLRV